MCLVFFSFTSLTTRYSLLIFCKLATTSPTGWLSSWLNFKKINNLLLNMQKLSIMKLLYYVVIKWLEWIPVSSWLIPFNREDSLHQFNDEYSITCLTQDNWLQEKADEKKLEGIKILSYKWIESQASEKETSCWCVYEKKMFIMHGNPFSYFP